MTQSAISPSPPALLIDASIYIFHYYFALPDHWFSEKAQWPTAAVYGYTTFLIRLLKNEQPKRIAACFDESLGSCFRNDIYPGYKASRALPDEALAFQLNACREVTELLGIASFSSERYEADDLIGSLYQRLYRSKPPIAILTRDKDLGQLLQRDLDYLWDYLGEKKYFSPDIENKFGVKPKQLAEYLALVGDSIDDIPGVPGIGAKTARQLLTNLGSIDNMLSNLEVVNTLPVRGAKLLGQKLIDYREQIFMARELATIKRDLSLVERISLLKLQTPNRPALEKFCQRMGFSKLFTTMQTLI